MNRPADWSPLCGSDPTPGHPDVVGDEAGHYDHVAAELRAQVSRLRRIGADDELRGQYAERLREAADELVGDLQKVERRYARVAAALRRWEPQLREGQQHADRIRRRARTLDEERRALHRQAATVGRRRLPIDPTPAQLAAFEADRAAAERIRRRLDDIAHGLRKLQHELVAVADRVNADGRAVGAEIRSAVDDDIEDTTWENVHGAAVRTWRAAVDSWNDFAAHIKANIDGIKQAVEVLQYLAMALAVIALFVPGLNLVIVGLTLGLFLTQAILYASGNGSITDLLLATLSLATLGLGAVGGKLIAGTFKRTRAAAAKRAGLAAARKARTQTAPAREALRRRLGRRLQPAQRAHLQRQLARANARATAEDKRAAALAKRAYAKKPLEPATWRDIVLDGGKENARRLDHIARMQQQFPHGDVRKAAGPDVQKGLNYVRAGQWGDAFFGAGDAVVGKSEWWRDKPHWQEYEDVKKNSDPLR